MTQAPVPLITHLELGRLVLDEGESPLIAKIRMAFTAELLGSPVHDVIDVATYTDDGEWEVDSVASGFETAGIAFQHNLNQFAQAMQERGHNPDGTLPPDMAAALEHMKGADFGDGPEDEYDPGGYL